MHVDLGVSLFAIGPPHDTRRIHVSRPTAQHQGRPFVAQIATFAMDGITMPVPVGWHVVVGRGGTQSVRDFVLVADALFPVH